MVCVNALTAIAWLLDAGIGDVLARLPRGALGRKA
jgi:hypothetical protein